VECPYLFDAHFTLLSGLVVDTDGTLYVGDASSLRKITPEGVVTTVAGNALVTTWQGDTGLPGVMRFVHALALDGQGNLLVTTANGLVRIAP